MGIIERIRHKPYEYRVKITWILLIISGIILITLWVLTSLITKKPTSTEPGLFHKIDSDVKESREYWENARPKKPENLN